MVNLSTSDARILVRKNLDEQDPNGSVMYADENGSSSDYGDNESLDKIIARNLPEAINAIHKSAPVWLLEGVALTAQDIATVTEEQTTTSLISIGTNPSDESYGVLSFTMKDTTEYLRLVSFRAADSLVTVTDVIPEASPEGRKQLNQYIRGRHDRPRLVQLQGRHTGPSFKYYTVTTPADYSSNPFTAIAQMEYVKEQFYTAPTELVPDPAYPISRRLRQNIVDYLTAMVMDTFGDQRSQAYYTKANIYSNI